MEFRLTYEGLLMSSGNSHPHADHKHDIRMKFHPQLKRLWEQNLALVGIGPHKLMNIEQAHIQGDNKLARGPEARPYLDLLAEAHEHHNRNWCPLVTEGLGLSCAVDILFLRPGSRGGALQLGDIDGRIKTLFDALAIPRSAKGLPAPDKSMGPIYTLLEDDSLITHVSVTTDELLQVADPSAGVNDSRVVITVNVRPTAISLFNLSFAGI